MGNAELNYSLLDRLVHRIAFAGPGIQLTAADAERALFGSTYAEASGHRPIFVTSLPRAGTTLMLEALSAFPSLATHLYRDMPFVMAPLLWSRLMGAFRKQAVPRERAHGDGIQIGYDSPEAFEEILWRTFWPDKYGVNSIGLWEAADVRQEPTMFFAEHMKKIVALRRPGRLRDGRYISKNNGNVGRLGVIHRMFPDATIIVPFRHPIEHAISLLRQHRSFTRMHAEQPFVQRYMADIGHYEFGALHRPIEFPGLRELTSGHDPNDANYWVGYWIAAFRHVLTHRERVTLIPYEIACRDGIGTLRQICDIAGIAEDGTLTAAASRFSEPPPARRADFVVDVHLRDRALALHAELSASSPMGRGTKTL